MVGIQAKVFQELVRADTRVFIHHSSLSYVAYHMGHLPQMVMVTHPSCRQGVLTGDIEPIKTARVHFPVQTENRQYYQSATAEPGSKEHGNFLRYIYRYSRKMQARPC